MIFSKSCEYALRAALFVAHEESTDYISITQISEKLDISRHFLTKILQQLTAAGLMESMKGPKGGVRLATANQDIALIDIVAATDGLEVLTECALGLPGCGQQKPCPIHDQWTATRDQVRLVLENNSLGDLVEKGKSDDLRITPDGKLSFK
ncbi:MAG: Rrf2 family transcriptional regulator [Balneolaceae bacterium]|nr:Rrf2 family transcriptional regulator [Balneolaceae bacterium]